MNLLRGYLESSCFLFYIVGELHRYIHLLRHKLKGLYMLNQNRMPFVEALEEYRNEHYVPFHTPGHKTGLEAPTLLKEWMGNALSYDLGVMYALDDLHEPEGALLEAQQLSAELYGADYCWFSINGTTSLIETMIMATVGEGDTIILPRETHKSVISGLVLSGAHPVYMEPVFDDQWGIPIGVTVEEAIRQMDLHSQAKAILLVYPNYYGVGVQIEDIVKAAHERNIIVLVDEAHGAHLLFSKELPIEAIQCGADLVAQSTHKLIGSLTQTSMLFGQGKRIDYRRVTQMHQMLQSTSPNYIFLASLDMARHQMAINGVELLSRTISLAKQLRTELNDIRGIKTMDLNSICDKNRHFDFTKVLIDAGGLGLTGVEFERLLRCEHIEVELVQANHVLVLVTIGDSSKSIGALVEAVKTISCNRETILHSHDKGTPVISHGDFEFPIEETDPAESSLVYELPTPVVRFSPRQGVYKERERVSLLDNVGRISGETISYYPPGIPFVSIGEEITPCVVKYIEVHKQNGYVPNGANDGTLETVLVLK